MHTSGQHLGFIVKRCQTDKYYYNGVKVRGIVGGSGGPWRGSGGPYGCQGGPVKDKVHPAK